MTLFNFDTFIQLTHSLGFHKRTKIQKSLTYLSKLKLSAISPLDPLLWRCQNLRYIHDSRVPLPHIQGYVPSKALTAHKIIAAMRINNGNDRFVSLPENHKYILIMIKIIASSNCLYLNSVEKSFKL